MKNCCLCWAVTGEDRPGDFLEGSAIVLCPEHRAQINERVRKAPPPLVPLSTLYERAFAGLALAGEDTSPLSLAPLANLAVPTTQTVQ